MGCSNSKSGLSGVDDSVHAMLAHEKKVAKMKGETPHEYVPRAPHPLLMSNHKAADQPEAAEPNEYNSGKSNSRIVVTEDDDDQLLSALAGKSEK